ncbi:MAG: hypothetical protein GYA17_00945 [Chloroflexi bacterium]|nr:hypothetical protein [Chloroflexota bacterium]
MKRAGLLFSVFLGAFLVLGFLVGNTRPAEAGPLYQSERIIRGAMLYDQWYVVLGVDPPAGDMPVWSRQSSNTRSGGDTWRCSTCHGWDYQGKDGAYRSGSNFTGFPGVLDASKTMSEEEIVQHLKGQNDPAHDFSVYMDESALEDVAYFIKNGLIDDNLFIDPLTGKVTSGDQEHGKGLFLQQCAQCHGQDGSQILFRYEGQNATLGTMAVIDPWRFLHKTRFGTPGTPMTIGYALGWTPQDGQDVLHFAQSLAPNVEPATGEPVMNERSGGGNESPGGPATSWFTGLLTALGAMAASLGFALAFGGVFIGIVLILVWIIRTRR